MSSYNKITCINNIYYIAKEKNIKIGDLESVAGVSSGYLSRLAKEGNESNASIDTLDSIANTLGVSLDLLISYDFTELSGTEKYMIDFLNKMINQTKENNIKWEYYTLKKFYDYEDETQIITSKIRVNDYNNGYSYYSLFRQCNLKMIDEIYLYYIDTLNYIILSKVNNEKNETAYEMYLDKISYGVDTLCSSHDGTNKIFSKLLEELYILVQKQVRQPSLNEYTKEILDAFMSK